MTLAGQQDKVAALCLLKGVRDGLSAILYDSIRGIDVFHSHKNVIDDSARILAAGIIRRDNHIIRLLGCNLAHNGAL